MRRIILVYGAISGSVIIGITIGSLLIFEPGSSAMGSEWMGYLIMIIVLSLIFFGVKSYRDEELGGVISFKKALGLGLGIAAVAGIFYTGIWEIYVQATGGEFIDLYIESHLQGMRESGAAETAIAQAREKMQEFKEMYQNPLIRMAITFMEIFPVGLVISLISAALLRKSDFLPAA